MADYNRMITATLSLSEWARAIGVTLSTLHRRLKRGWTIEQAITVPLEPRMTTFTAFGKTQTLVAWSRECRMHETTLRRRLKLGMTPEQALTAPPYTRTSNNGAMPNVA